MIRIVLECTALSLALAAAIIVLVPIRGAWWQRSAYEGLSIAGFVVAVVACAWRSSTAPSQRWVWRLQGLALLAYLGGDLYAAHSNDHRTPSPADAMWLCFYLLTYASVLLHARARCRTRPPRAWLDGMTAGLTITAVAAALIFKPLLTRGKGAPWTLATNLAYPIADLILLLLIVCALQVAPSSEWSPNLQWVGLASFLIADVAYLLGQAHGTWVVTSPFRLAWFVGVVLVALSASAPTSSERQLPVAPHLLVPTSATIVAIALLVYGQWSSLPPIAIALAVGAVLAALIRVIFATQEIRRHARSKNEARYDSLTGLLNRRGLSDRLGPLLSARMAIEIAVLSVDIDGFKVVNQTVGYDNANHVLRTLAGRLGALLPPRSFAARVGDDEFAVVIPLDGTTDPERFAVHIRADLRHPIDANGIPFSLSSTIGIATAPRHGGTPADILASAGVALHQAKKSRTHVASYRSEGADADGLRLVLLSQIHAALSSGEIIAHLQPQIDLVTGRVTSVEALARWDHPTEGLIPPVHFLPLILECGLMSALTSRMLEEATSTIEACANDGHHIGVSVNVSALDLADDSMIGRVERAIEAIRPAGGQLTLELTEDAVLADLARAVDVLARTRALGARVSVDDYGTGHASLSYLRDLPLDELKLDRSFVLGGSADRRASAIARSTVELAHQLGLSTVGEGIEDAEVALWLQQMGCDLGQGFHFARPMPLGKLLIWLNRQTAK